MSAAHKAKSPGGVGDSANLKTDTASLATAQNLSKSFATLRAEFALRGHTLQALVQSGREVYVVARWGHSRMFSHMHDLQAFLAQIGGAQ